MFVTFQLDNLKIYEVFSALKYLPKWVIFKLNCESIAKYWKLTHHLSRDEVWLWNYTWMYLARTQLLKCSCLNIFSHIKLCESQIWNFKGQAAFCLLDIDETKVVKEPAHGYMVPLELTQSH